MGSNAFECCDEEEERGGTVVQDKKPRQPSILLLSFYSIFKVKFWDFSF